MSESEAMDMLNLHTEPERDPKLSAGTLMKVLHQYQSEDMTYEDEGVMRAICDAWDLKVNKSTDYFDLSVNGRNMNTNQVKSNCEERARYYRRRLPVHVA
jgi:hypothetical protein